MQMVALQFFYYAGLTLCIIVVDLVSGLRPHSAQIFYAGSFDWTAERYGTATIVAHSLNIPFMVFAEAHIVEKAIKCLDYTLTVVFFHLIAMSMTYGFPGWAHKFDWWMINAAIVTAQCVFSEMLCMKLETQEIKLTVDDIIESGKRGAQQILTVVQNTGAELAESTSKLNSQGASALTSGIAKKKKKKKAKTIGSSISHNSQVIQRSTQKSAENMV